MSDQDDDYKVGYGKPPVSTRFRKGRSGNPKGHPKRAKGVRASLRRELEAKITVRDNGRETRMSKAEALAKQLTAKALKGDSRAMAELLKHDLDLFVDAQGDGEMAAMSLPPDAVEFEILREFFSETTASDAHCEDREADNDDA